MFSKIIKKIQAPAETIPDAPLEINSEAAWELKFKASTGNDQTLLALAIEATSVEHKLACVQSLSSEEGLKAAEREFRKHDRRVHSLAKQRHEAVVKQRETRSTAAQLIQSAEALIDAPMIPANHLAEINLAWEQLDHTLLKDNDISRFSALQTSLSELIRERGERKRAVSRWSLAANQALTELCSAGACVAAASIGLQELSERFTAAGVKARATLTEIPAIGTPALSEDSAIAALASAIQSALGDSAIIEARLAILDELQAAQQTPVKDESHSTITAVERWKVLPSIADQHIESALNTRFEEYLHLQNLTHKKLQKQNSLVASKNDKATLQAHNQALLVIADATDAALADGNLSEAGKQLTILQAASDKGGTSSALQSRIGALQAEFTRLKGWQHWGGGRVRDDLVVEAETLAASTVIQEGSRPVKFPVKQLENSIEQLRLRWKELDRLGGATNKPLWQRFEAALKTAYAPVAAHLAQLSEARKENLTLRKNLLNALDALKVTEAEQPDWKEISRALSHFQTEWRKLGPLEHTAPHKSQPALLERMKASIARLEDPLKQIYVSAQAEREQLIMRVKALSRDVQGRDMLVKLRELQSQWQIHAKSKPLPRKSENMLWAEFKAASDALIGQREAAFSARDDEFKANQLVREALIARLEELHQDTPPADIKRTIASVDAELRKAGEAPRSQAARLEARYRVAREHAQEHITGSAQRSWQLICDTLQARLALCAELEAGAAPAVVEARWLELTALPARWEQAMQTRYKTALEGGSANSGELLDKLLLQLESTLEIPSPAAFQAARRTLKLMAMKNAMEGRRSSTPAWPDIEKMTAEAIGYASISADQNSRLQSIIGALRKSGPAS
jgi:DNA repair protein SbcC/Rad50